jgi:hypothetical protein
MCHNILHREVSWKALWSLPNQEPPLRSSGAQVRLGLALLPGGLTFLARPTPTAAGGLQQSSAKFLPAAPHTVRIYMVCWRVRIGGEAKGVNRPR